MKKNIIYMSALALLTLVFAGCEKYEDDTIDFSNKYKGYVDFSSVAAKTVAEGSEVAFVVRMNPIQYKDVTVDYAVTGGYATAGQLVIKSGAPNAQLKLTIPDNGVAEGSKDATITLTTVSDGLAVGRIGKNIKVVLTITD